MTYLDNPFEPSWARVKSGVLLIFGVALPIVALLLEITTGMCAEVLFDPVPTLFHALLVAFVAAANASVWVVVKKHQTPRTLRWARWVNAVAIGIAGVYTVMFLPTLPLATLAILL